MLTIKKKLPEFIKLCQHFYTGQTFKYLTIEINGLIPFSKITAHKKNCYQFRVLIKFLLQDRH